MTSSEEEPRRLNLLLAYPYMDRATETLLAAKKDEIRFVLDSGAFTAWKAGKSIQIDDYCRFVEGMTFEPWRYFTLDVIGDPEASLKNYDLMVARGFKPLPIFTRGEDPSVIDYYYSTSDVVGIGGLVGTKGNKGFINGIMSHVGRRKVHWLGFTSVEFLKHYRPYMCDSSSWASALIYASLKIYAGKGRFISCTKKDFAKRPRQEILDVLDEYEIDPRELAKESNWKNSGVGNYPTEKIAFRSYVRYQRDIEANLKTKMFMAVSCEWQAKLSLEAFEFWEARQ